MEMLIDHLQRLSSELIVKAFGKALKESPELLTAEVTPSTKSHFGHYQCNSALKIGKALQTSPREVAHTLAEAFEATHFFSTVEVAGPGFINLTLTDAFLSKGVTSMLLDDRLGVPLPRHPKRVIVEFSSPNVAKELHVGHLRTTIIGDCIARIFEFLGHDVLRLNHVGDWGTQFGMLIAYLKEHEPQVLTGEEETDLTHLMQWYRASKQLFDADPAFKERAQIQVVRLQSGAPDAIKAWEMICEISRKGYQEVYEILDVHIIERGESFYNPMLPKVVADLEKKGLIEVSEGAKCVFLNGFVTKEGTPLPMIVQKSDGGYNYATTDMAAIKQRIEEEKADRIILVIGAEQNLHIKMIIQAAEKAGYLDPKKVEVNHVAFGGVLNQEGKKFQTRSGDTEKLIDLLMEAVSQAKKIISERLPDATHEEINHLAKVIGIDAVKYSDLSCHRIKDYIFSYERMLKFEGNTAVFLLYSYVRVQGIKRKVKRAVEELIGKTQIELKHPSEVDLGLHLCRFGEMLESVAHDLLPHRLSEYLYTLAEKFNAFFRDCRVEGSDEEASRLLLCETTARTLEKGLNLLGLRTVERM